MKKKVMAGVAACAALALCLIANAQEKKPAPSDADLIKSAMSAAPANVGKNATIVAMEADGKMRPKAVKVRDYLARALMDAFEEGVESMVDSIDGG